MCGPKALDKICQHPVDHFLHGKRLRARCCQERQAAHLIVEFFGAGARAFQNYDNHRDPQGHSQ